MNTRTDSPDIELLLELTAQTRLVSGISQGPTGDRYIFDVIGGTFEGPTLRGRVLASGGDWVTRSQARSSMDVRLVLETHDGVTLLLQYRGRAHQAGATTRIEVVGALEAPAGPYDGLNDVQVFGLGTVLADGVRYSLYRFK